MPIMRIRLGRRGGFTLVELLVVIAIIAILASLSFPALSSSKAKGQSAVCKNNLRQIAVSYTMAVEDNDGVFGPCVAEFFAWDKETFDQYRALRYGLFKFWARENGASDVWICPTAPRRVAASAEVNGPGYWPGTTSSAWRMQANRMVGGPLEKRASSYTGNGWLGMTHSQSEWPDDPNVYAKDADVGVPSETPSFGDGTLVIDFFHEQNNSAPSSDSGAGFLVARHGSRPGPLKTAYSREEKLPGTINISFADAHVEQAPLERLWFLRWHKNSVPGKRPD
jgi:prepilin-type N-terminal cleavage/methylation domain-containing protein/prepilin-type processing-associated H-X9-DG protein